MTIQNIWKSLILLVFPNRIGCIVYASCWAKSRLLWNRPVSPNNIIYRQVRNRVWPMNVVIWQTLSAPKSYYVSFRMWRKLFWFWVWLTAHNWSDYTVLITQGIGFLNVLFFSFFTFTLFYWVLYNVVEESSKNKLSGTLKILISGLNPPDFYETTPKCFYSERWEVLWRSPFTVGPMGLPLSIFYHSFFIKCFPWNKSL